MKRFKAYLRILLSVVFVFLTTTAQASVSAAEHADYGLGQVKVSLLTCSGGQEIWSVFGHTALRIQDPRNGVDVAVNWGLFSFSQKFFIARFVFGRCDYQLGIEPFDAFLQEYREEGRGVIQQEVNLTPQEKSAILQALMENYREEKRTYRYNFFYDNCTSRARDMIVDHINGQVDYHFDPEVTSSYRTMVHQWNYAHRWQQFGEDLLLGLAADFKTDGTQQQFLPDTLRKDFARATVVRAGNRVTPLVGATQNVLQPVEVDQESGFWDVVTPDLLFAVLLLLTLGIEVIEWRRRKLFWGIDLVLGIADGLAGLILLAMVFSLHPTVRLNLQILLLNPLTIVFLWPWLKAIRHGRLHWYGSVVFPICVILFLIGNFFQSYAEGMGLLALLLLSRCCMGMFAAKNFQISAPAAHQTEK